MDSSIYVDAQLYSHLLSPLVLMVSVQAKYEIPELLLASAGIDSG